MSDDIEDTDDIKEKRVCDACVGDEYLKKEIRSEGEAAECSYCEQRRKTMPIGDFADYIEQAFEHHYVITPEDYYPNDERDGDPVGFLIQEAALIDEPIAEDVRLVLEDRGPSGKDALIDENPFSEDAHYRRKEVWAGLYADEWARFRKSVESEARMFNSEAEGILNQIFEGLEDYATWHGRKIIVPAGPSQTITALYRARVFQSDEKLEHAIGRPEKELGPPPPAAAIAGRMNSRGIGVFYGATHPRVALAETRPPVGSRVLLGRFEIIRPLWLLDVGALRTIKAKGNIFQEFHLEELERTAFLSTLSSFITRPVMPEDETSEYLATQAIADYLATRDNPALDGIIYPSAQQSGKRKRNVVLFHKASRVEDLGLPRHTQISAHIHEHDEDGIRPDYSVSVRKPPVKKKDAEPRPVSFVDAEGLWELYPDPRRDSRTPALRIDLASVKVNEVTGVSFRSFDLPVKRNEYEMTETELEKLQEDDAKF